ncbi:MAG: adenylate/guanylate cyclase domain-containing protein [Chloroflexi bacterium]|nr:adenylate/guanylate cyclase domain-containing protein [Chloroflexota bacterium]
MEPQVRFCTSADGTSIAYATLGEGPPLVHLAPWTSDMEWDWERPEGRTFMEGLAEGRMLVLPMRRGVGASQRDVEDVSLEAQLADLSAVIDGLKLERFDLMGREDGGALCIAYAADHPEQVGRLVLWAPFVHGTDVVGPEAGRSLVELVRANWPLARRAMADIIFPNGPIEWQKWMSSYFREAVSNKVVAKHLEFTMRLDVRAFASRLEAPTLVLHRRLQRTVPIAAGRAAAALIPDARFITLEGDVAYAYFQPEQALKPIRDFLDEGREAAAGESALPEGMTAILFLDIADSTALTTKLGDAAYREKERELDASLRAAITEASGTPVEGKVLGDGVMAVFTSARQAIDAAQRCRDLGNEAGLPLHLGIHAGDVVREGNNVHGGAVQVASRVQGVAAPGEILVSATVRDLARTSAGVAFEDRGEHELKGIAEPQRLFAVRPGEVG